MAGELWAPPFPSASSPLLLCRTAEPLAGVSALARSCAALGYRVVLQSVRGRGGSGGQFYPYAQESADGEDTLRHLRREAFLGAGGILPFGFGYAGQAALALALRTPPEFLCGLALSGVTASHFQSGLCNNGVPHGEALFALTRWLPARSRPSRADFAEWLLHPRWQAGLSPYSSVPSLEEWVLTLRDSPTWNAFWKSPALCPQAFARQLPDCPVFLCGGTAALTGAGTLALAEVLSAHNNAPLELWMGDWDDEALLDSDSRSPVCQRLLAWLTQTAGKKTRRSRNARNIHYLIRKLDGAVHWRQWTNWPSLDMESQKLFLQPGKLASAAPNAASSCDYLDNPRCAPVIPPGNSWGLTAGLPAFGVCQLPLAIRADALAFTSTPFPDELTLAGQPRLRLRVSSNRPDTQFLARLVALPPSPALGTSQTIAYGAMRLALRHGAENLVAFSPGMDSSTILSFSLTPTLCRLPSGSRLRLELSSNDFPRYSLSLNTLPATDHAPCPVPRTAHNTVELDTRGTSRLTLSILNKAPP
ncbi:MAG: CocE/NonD family hydrolase [Victivallales bacterium]|nr:CocE/NonD family hydrolase [Victivallales bacterium]